MSSTVQDVINQPRQNDQNVRLNWIQWAIQAVSEEISDYQRFEDYYAGDHKLEFATNKWSEVFSTTFKHFADNWCQVVVDSMIQRVNITGWMSDGDQSSADKAQEIWDRQDLLIEAQDLHTQTVVKGDGYLIVWEDQDDPTLSQMYYNDPLEVVVKYDPSNRRNILRAAKRFTDEQGQAHLYIYFPDRCEKYYVPNNMTPDLVAAMQLDLVEFGQVVPGGFTKEAEDVLNPYGQVPVFHFKNRSLGTNNGLSELKSVIPVQNAVNKLLMDMMVASEFGSFRQKWMAGGGHPKDGWKSGASRIWATTDANAKFGEFSQTDLEPIFKAVDILVGHIGKITQTPLHYLRSSGDMPSGAALKTAESGLVKKVLERTKQWRAPWSKAMAMAIQIETGAKPTSPVYPVWEDPETRHDLEQAQTAQLKSILGIPLKQLWQEHFNYTKDQIALFEKENKAIAASALADVLAQTGQLPPGTGDFVANPLQLVQLLKGHAAIGGNDGSGSGLDISQILALLPKSVTGQTTAGEATTNPQPGTKPPASATRKQRGYDAGVPSTQSD